MIPFFRKRKEKVQHVFKEAVKHNQCVTIFLLYLNREDGSPLTDIVNCIESLPTVDIFEELSEHLFLVVMSTNGTLETSALTDFVKEKFEVEAVTVELNPMLNMSWLLNRDKTLLLSLIFKSYKAFVRY